MVLLRKCSRNMKKPRSKLPEVQANGMNRHDQNLTLRRRLRKKKLLSQQENSKLEVHAHVYHSYRWSGILETSKTVQTTALIQRQERKKDPHAMEMTVFG